MSLDKDIVGLLKSEGYKINDDILDLVDEFIKNVEDVQQEIKDDEAEEEEE